MKKSGFTLSEVLSTLTIIGVVAAISIPSIMVNINDRSWEAQRKALYTRLSHAVGLIPRLNGYGTSDDNSTEAFINEGLAKMFKMSTVCKMPTSPASPPDNLCGFPLKNIKTLGGNSTIANFPIKLNEFNSSFAQTLETVAFKTLNGESILVFYNRNCTADEDVNHTLQDKMCVNFIYDLNGSKSPNTVGKDIGFITAMYRRNPAVVAPQAFNSNAESATFDNASESCETKNSNSRLPNKDELASMFYNRSLLGLTTGQFWSETATLDGSAWIVNFQNGERSLIEKSNEKSIRCVSK